MRASCSFAVSAKACILRAALLLCFLLAWFGGHASAQTSAALRLPTALVYDAAGNLYIADAGRHQVLEASLAGVLSIVAGNGTQGFAGDGGPASAAELNSPNGLVFGPDGTLYIADTSNARIRAVHAGTITTFAGRGVQGSAADGSLAMAASLRSPTALAFDNSGALLICDTGDHRIRRIAGGIITTFAGNGTQGFAGDGGPARIAELDAPSGIAVAPDGRVFIADTHNHRVRTVAVNGTISTFAGTGQRGFHGDNGPAASAQFVLPHGLVFASGNLLLIADTGNRRVRRINAQGTIATLAGMGTEGHSTDGDLASSAALRSPRALAVSSFDMPTFADALNGTVDVLTPASTLFQPAALAPGRFTVLQPATITRLVYAAGAAFIATSGSAGTPQGAVSLVEGGATLSSTALQGGAASLDLGKLNAGTHTLTLSYSGDGLNPAATLILPPVTITPAPVTAVASGATMPFGATSPTLQGSLMGVLPQDAGQVSAVFTADPRAGSGVGIYPIAVSLNGPQSGNYAVVLASNSGVLTVTPADTRTLLSSVPQGFAGMPMRLSANVLPTTAGHPTGSVQFLDGSAVIATAAVVNGSASALYTAPPSGPLSLSAKYSGDDNFTPSLSLPQVAVVNPLPDFNVTPGGSASATVTGGTTATYSLLVSAQPAPFTGVVAFSASGLPAGATVTFSPVQVVPGVSSATVMVSVVTPYPMAGLPAGNALGAGTQATLAGLVLGLGLIAGRRRRAVWLLSLAVFACGCGARTVGEPGSGLVSQTYSLQMKGTSTNLLGNVVTHSAALTLTVQN